MSAKQMTDSVYEALFRQAVIENFYNQLDSLPPAEELAILYKPSDLHSTRMKRLFAGEKRKERVHTVMTWSKRVTAAILTITFVLFGSLMLVPEVRAAVTETIIEWYERFVRFTSNTSEVEKTNLEPTYIPDGFREEVRDENELIMTILFINADGIVITFQSSRSSGSLSVDSEERAHEIMSIDNIDYHAFIASEVKNENSIIWDISEQRYLITSAISLDELIKIALSVD